MLLLPVYQPQASVLRLQERRGDDVRQQAAQAAGRKLCGLDTRDLGVPGEVRLLVMTGGVDLGRFRRGAREILAGLAK